MSIEKTNEKNALSSGTAEDVVNGETLVGNSVPDCSIFVQREQGVVEKVLRHGRENAIQQADLARLLGMPERNLRSEITRERYAGVPILSDVGGYYLPASEETWNDEVTQMAHRYFARAGRQFRIGYALLKPLNIAGQLTIDPEAVDVIEKQNEKDSRRRNRNA